MPNSKSGLNALPGQLWLVNFDLKRVGNESLLREVGDDDGPWIGRIIDINEDDRSDEGYEPIYEWRCDQVNGTATVYLRPGGVTPVHQLVASTEPR